MQKRLTTATGASLATTAVGVTICGIATVALIREGAFGPDGIRAGRLDFVTAAVWLLGVAIVLGGAAVLLVAAADRLLGAVPSTEAAPEGRARDTASAPPATSPAASAAPAPVDDRPRDRDRAGAVAPERVVLAAPTVGQHRAPVAPDLAGPSAYPVPAAARSSWVAPAGVLAARAHRH